MKRYICISHYSVYQPKSHLKLLWFISSAHGQDANYLFFPFLSCFCMQNPSNHFFHTCCLACVSYGIQIISNHRSPSHFTANMNPMLYLKSTKCILLHKQIWRYSQSLRQMKYHTCPCSLDAALPTLIFLDAPDRYSCMVS